MRPLPQEALSALAQASCGWGLPLDAAALESFRRYALLVGGYPRANLVSGSERDPETILLRHIADGIATAALLKGMGVRGQVSLSPNPHPLTPNTSAAPRVLDLGSGAGFLGISLKIAWPQAFVELSEPQKRRFDFLNAALLDLGLRGIGLKRAGALEIPALREPPYDAVLSRALAPLPQALDLAAPLAGPGGLVLLSQSAAPDPGAPQLSKALARAGARLVKSWPYRLPREDKDRHITVFERAS